MKTSSIILLAACQLLTGTAFALTPLSENFNATALNQSRWTLKNYGKGKLSTFSPTGRGGDRRGNWDMNLAGGRFGIQLFGFSDGANVAAGKVSFDNFKLKALR